MNCGLNCDIHEYTPRSVVHVEVNQFICWTSACLRHMKIVWPFSASSFGFWTQQVSPSLLSRDCSRIQIQKIPMIFDFSVAKVCIFQPSLRSRWCVGFCISSCPRVNFPCRCFEYPRAFRRKRMVHGWGTCQNSCFQAHCFDFATILSSVFCSCILSAIVLGQQVKLKLWAQQREEMADVEQMKKIVPLITCEITFGQHVCEFDVWCRCTLFGSRWPQLIVSNNQSRATLWVLALSSKTF